MSEKIYDLDAELPAQEFIKLGGYKINISFVPCGVAIPLATAYEKWVQKSIEDGGIKGLEKDYKVAHINALLQIKIVSIFTEYCHPELSEEWLLKNVPFKNITFLVKKLVSAIMGKIEDKDKITEKKRPKLNGKESLVKSA